MQTIIAQKEVCCSPSVLSVLFLHDGSKLWKELTQALVHVQQDMRVKLSVEVLDLSSQKFQRSKCFAARLEKLAVRARRGSFGLVVVVPEYGTFSRTPWLPRFRTKPFRSSTQPFGLRSLFGRRKERCASSNKILEFVGELVRAQCEAGNKWLLGHPENLGRVRGGGYPASLWQLSSIKDLGKLPGARSGAVHMSEYGAQTLRPTRLLTNLSFPSQAWSHGWPTFEGDGKYTGSLFRVQAPVIPKNVKPSQAWPSKLLAVMLRAFVADSQVSGSTSTKGGEFVNRGGRGKKRLLPPVEATVPQRRKVTEEQLVQLGQGVQLGEGVVYIGRGGRYGVPRSKWANPAKIGKDGDRDQVIKSFMTYAVKRGLDVDAGVELRGKDLLCHCDGDVNCHGDVLLRWANQTGTGQRTPRTMEEEASVEGDLLNDGLSGRFEEGGVGQEVSEEVASGGALGRLRHKGQPRKAWCFGKLRPFADGGGLCSPGRWPKDVRAYPEGRWHGIRDRLWQVFGSEVARLGFHDATDFAVRVAACRFGDCPFSESALAKARSVVSDALAVPKEEQEVASGQVVHLRLVKALLHEAGDPDSQLMDVLAA